MPTSVGPNTFGEENLVFGYDLGDTVNSYRGEPTVNYITTMAANLGGNVSLSYPNNVYICTAQETNVIDPNAPGGQYSRFTGNTDSDNNQLFTSFVDGSVNARNTTVAYSVYLKGTGTCHLTVYSDIAGYSTTPTINLTGEWTRYSIVQAVGNYTTYAWSAVRGILTSTNVYVAAQQVEFKSHVTPFINGTRSATQGLIDLTGTSTIDLTNVSFDSNAQMTFDGTDDYVEMSSFNIDQNNEFTLEAIIYPNTVSGNQSIIKKNTSNDNWPIFSLTLVGSNIDGYYSSPTYGQCLEGAYGTSGIITANKFWHVAYSKGVGGYTTMKLYINGVSVPYNNYLYGSHINSIATSTKPIHIGRNLDGASWIQPFNGIIPVSRVYNRQLTDSEIRANYNAIKGRFNI